MGRFTDVLLSTPDMRAVFSDIAWVQRMLDAEAALARAEEAAGVVPPGTAGAIEAACRAELFDVEAIAEQGAVAGTPVIPLGRMRVERAGGECLGLFSVAASARATIGDASRSPTSYGRDASPFLYGSG